MPATAQPPPFSCHVREDAARAVLALRGELDLATVGMLETCVDDILSRGARAITVDLSGLAFVDSTGLRCLMSLGQSARRDGIDLELVPATDGVMRIFDLTGTRDVLPFRRAA